jgi:hypothetical protein
MSKAAKDAGTRAVICSNSQGHAWLGVIVNNVWPI